jgi:hypothetical protein
MQRCGKWMCFHPQVMGETPTLMGPLERANLSHWTQQSGCLPPSPENRNMQFPKRSLVLLECQTMGKGQKPSNSECYTSSVEPFRIYLHVSYPELFSKFWWNLILEVRTKNCWMKLILIHTCSYIYCNSTLNEIQIKLFITRLKVDYHIWNWFVTLSVELVKIYGIFYLRHFSVVSILN